MTAKKIKIAIVGTGGMAHYHANIFKTIKDCIITACCDINRERAENYAKEFGINKVYTDYKKMLNECQDINAVVVATSDAFHATVSIASFKAGKHVFCEKPISTNISDTIKMIEASKKSNKINMINFGYRCSSAAIKAAELLKEGKLGEIKHIEASYLQSWVALAKPEDLDGNWRLSKKLGGTGVLGDIGCHILDLTTFVAGDISKIRCTLKTHKIPNLKNNVAGKTVLDANTSAFILGEFKNGALGIIHATQFATGHANSLRLRVYGSLGAVEVDLDTSYTDLKVFFCKKNQEKWGDMKWNFIHCGKITDNQNKFIISIKTGKQHSPTFEDGFKIQKYLDACFKSDKNNGKPVNLYLGS
ncbi:MAG: Gfo/Idh/MocA family oxidoreductase [Elusimicrobia bacterium]|nr:Gfo/Idh/MocA family oxidoreductase [Elusimicrobiota bacterium]